MAKGTIYGKIRKSGTSYVITVTDLVNVCGFEVGEPVKLECESIHKDEYDYRKQVKDDDLERVYYPDFDIEWPHPEIIKHDENKEKE